MQTEEWREVEGFPGYEVSSLGRVRSIRVLAPSPNDKGYMKVKLTSPGGVVTTAVVHRLVIRAFKGPKPAAKSVTRHLDDDKSNNVAGNLVWGTHSENRMDAKRNRQRRLDLDDLLS